MRILIWMKPWLAVVVTLSLSIPVAEAMDAKEPPCTALFKKAVESLEYLSTKDFTAGLPKKNEYSSLIRTVQRFEKSGGGGAWTAAANPFALGGENFPFYRIIALPPKVDPASDLRFLRTEQDLAFAKRVLLDRSVPVYLTQLPEGTANAFVVSSHFETAAHLLAVDKSPHRSVLVLQAAADRFIIAHEGQHWIDRETPAFAKERDQFLDNLAKAGLKQNEIDDLWQYVDEWRGHSAQEKAIHEAQLHREAFTPSRQDDLVLRPQKSDYDFEISIIFQSYEVLYLNRFRVLMAGIKKQSPAGYRKVLDQLEKWQISDGFFSLEHLGIR